MIVLRMIIGQDKMAAPMEDRITKIEFSMSYITVLKWFKNGKTILK